MSTGQFGYGGVPGCCVDPVCGYQILSSYFYVSQVNSGSKRDTNETPTCAVPIHAPQTNALW